MCLVPCRQEVSLCSRSERKRFRIETPAGLSRGHKFSDPDISKISRYRTQCQTEFFTGSRFPRKSRSSPQGWIRSDP